MKYNYNVILNKYILFSSILSYSLIYYYPTTDTLDDATPLEETEDEHKQSSDGVHDPESLDLDNADQLTLDDVTGLH